MVGQSQQREPEAAAHVHLSNHGRETEQQMLPSAQPAFCTLHGLGPPAEGLVSCTLIWIFWH